MNAESQEVPSLAQNVHRPAAALAGGRPLLPCGRQERWTNASHAQEKENSLGLSGLFDRTICLGAVALELLEICLSLPKAFRK